MLGQILLIAVLDRVGDGLAHGHEDPVPRLLRHVAPLEERATQVLHHLDVLETAGERHPDRAGFGGRSGCVHSRASKARRILSKRTAGKGTETRRATLGHAPKTSGPHGRNRPGGGRRSRRRGPAAGPDGGGFPERRGGPGPQVHPDGAGVPSWTRPRPGGSCAARSSRVSRVPVEEYFRSLAAIGLIEDSPRLLDSLVDFYASQVVAFYDPQSRRFFVVEGAEGLARRAIPRTSRRASSSPTS